MRLFIVAGLAVGAIAVLRLSRAPDFDAVGGVWIRLGDRARDRA